MLNFQSAPVGARMSQTPRTVAVPINMPPPTIDPVYSSFDGVSGIVESIVVLSIASAAAWIGIRTGMGKGNVYVKSAGWVGGIGSAVLGLLYLGGKSGYNQDLSLPAVRVTPS
jgi:hypothetical protein